MACETTCNSCNLCTCDCTCANVCAPCAPLISEEGCPSITYLECIRTQEEFSENDIEILNADNALEVINKIIDAIKALQNVGAVDKLVKISSADTTANYLESKIDDSTYITLTKNNPTLNEKLTISINLSTLETRIKDVTLENVKRVISSSTDYWKVPVGTTSQRPGSPTEGMIRYNKTTKKFEGYVGGTTPGWRNLS